MKQKVLDYMLEGIDDIKEVNDNGIISFQLIKYMKTFLIFRIY